MNISKRINDFEQLEKNSLDKFQAKFKRIFEKAQKIIDRVDIKFYEQMDQF